MSWFSRWFSSPSKKRASDDDIQDSSRGKKARVLFDSLTSGDIGEPFKTFGDSTSLAALITSSLIPRPLTLVAALKKSGELSLTTSTFCSIVSARPTYICVGLAKEALREDSISDPTDAIEQSKELTVSIVSGGIAKAATASPGSYTLPSTSTEADLKTGLTTSKSEKVQVPRISEAAVVLECKLRHKYNIKDSEGEIASTVVLAEVLCAGVKEEVLSEDSGGMQTVDAQKLRPVAALGQDVYAELSSTFHLPGLGALAGPSSPPRGSNKLPEEEVAAAVATAVADALEAEDGGPAVKAVEVTLGSEKAKTDVEIPVTITQAL